MNTTPSPSNNQPHCSQATFMMAGALFLAFFVNYLVWLSRSLNLPIFESLFFSPKSLYDPDKNIFTTPVINGYINIQHTYAMGVLITAAISAITARIFSKIFPKQSYSITHATSIVALLGLAGFILLQQTDRMQYFRSPLLEVSLMSTEEKKNALFGLSYRRAKATLAHLPSEPIQGKMISDEPTDSDEFLSFERAFAYHTFPQLSTRYDNGTPQAAILMFFSQDSENHLPDDYTIQYRTEYDRYILGIHKDFADDNTDPH